MSISNRKIDAWTSPVVSETDRPTRTADALKAVFDSNSNQLKAAHNALIDDLAGTGGAAEIGAAAIDGLTGATVQSQMESLNTKVFSVLKTTEESNRYLDGNGNYTVPQIGAAANGVPLGGANDNFLMKAGTTDFMTVWAGAESARSALNVADGADNTGAAVAAASAVTTLGDTDTIPAYSSGLKKITWAYVKGLLTTYFDALYTAALLTMTGYTKPASTSAVLTTDKVTEAIGKVEKGLDGKRSVVVTATSLPTSGSALSDNTEYRVSANVGTYAFAWPANPFEVWVKFNTTSSPSITFPSGTKYIGGAPSFAGSKTYEMSVKDGVVIVQEVTST